MSTTEESIPVIAHEEVSLPTNEDDSWPTTTIDEKEPVTEPSSDSIQDIDPILSLETSGTSKPVENVPKKRKFKPVDPLAVSARWKEYFDPKSSRYYYYDKKTKKTQWKKPLGFLSKKELLRPVAAVRIGESDWFCVTTFNQRDYFYHITSNSTAWELPEDFNTPISQVVRTKTDQEQEEDEEAQNTQNIKKRPRQSDESDDEANGRKKRKLDQNSEDQSNSEPKYPEEIVPEKEDAHEKRIRLFKLMLRQHGVDSTSTWADWHHKLEKDPRFHDIISIVERRFLLENFVRSLAAEKKLAVKQKIQAVKDAFTDIVKKSDKIDGRTSFDMFKDLFRETEEYQNLKKVSPDDILTVYDEIVGPLLEKQKQIKKKARTSFVEMLDEKIYDKFCKDTRQDWLDFKLQLEDDPRYNREMLSGIDREDLFEEWAREVAAEVQSKQKKEDKIKEALRKREEDVRRLKRR